MNEIVNKFFLTGDKFLSELNLRQIKFTYNACVPFIKHNQLIQKFN